MGLGKTVQMIALIDALIHRKKIVTTNEVQAVGQAVGQPAAATQVVVEQHQQHQQHQQVDNDPILVIMGKSILEQWKSEFQRFSSRTKVAIYGDRNKRDDILYKIYHKKLHVLLISYHLCCRESEILKLKELNGN